MRKYKNWRNKKITGKRGKNKRIGERKRERVNTRNKGIKEQKRGKEEKINERGIKERGKRGRVNTRNKRIRE